MSSRSWTLTTRASGAGVATVALLLWPALMGARGCDASTEPPTACPAIWAPVCGVDDVTYGSECAADAAGVAIAYDGECIGTGCFCTEEYAPVCGSDGLTYSNGCFASCAGVMVAYDGECATECFCPEIYAPVCGSDGVTYENECAANCAGAMAVHPGACECAPVLCDLYCEGGFERDPMTGCETCRCVTPDPTCVVDEDCGMGTYCDRSECWGIDGGGMGGTPPDPTLPPVCLGRCLPVAPPPPAWCTSDAECGPGARCDLVECVDVCAEDGGCFTECHGVCVGEPPPSDRCLADSDCAMGERCNTDACWSLCDPASPDMACPAVCAGICEPAIEPPPPPPPCSSDADCAEAEHCELIWCMGRPCAMDDPSCIASCGGACVPDVIVLPPPPPLEPCTSDADCGAFQVCALPTCIAGEDCPTIGVCLDTMDPGDPTEPVPAI